MTDYPVNFPQPTVNGFSNSIDTGLVRTEMENGFAKQRRRLYTMPQSFSLTFIVPIRQLNKWQLWVDSFAYDAFNMDISGKDGKCKPVQIQFTSDLAISGLTKDVFSVSVNAVEVT